MRRLLTTLAGVTLAVGLAAPAWADNAQKPAGRPITASGDRGHSRGRDGGRGSGRNRRGYDRYDYGYGDGYYGCNDPYGYGYYNASAPGADPTSAARSPQDDPPGEGRSHYDKLHHDEGSILF